MARQPPKRKQNKDQSTGEGGNPKKRAVARGKTPPSPGDLHRATAFPPVAAQGGKKGKPKGTPIGPIDATKLAEFDVASNTMTIPYNHGIKYAFMCPAKCGSKGYHNTAVLFQHICGNKDRNGCIYYAC